MREIELEIFIRVHWEKVGTVEFFESPQNQGLRATTHFTYHPSYIENHIDELGCRTSAAVSVNYPINYSPIKTAGGWAPFLLDIVPSGAARRFWLERVKRGDGPDVEIDLLTQGAINPPGNVRVVQDQKPVPARHPGFSKDDILSRDVDFMSYAALHGAWVAGSSGAPGESPKFLLVVDRQNKWHADGAIPDQDVQSHWLVKFPRSKATRDRQILEAEAHYYSIATDLGLQVHKPLQWQNNALFIPRFDRLYETNQWNRLGFESLNSSLKVTEFAVSRPHEEYLAAIHEFSDRSADIEEYILRDFVNIVMGNTDNHGRNTAFLKTSNRIELSPLFDFAPMAYDDAGILRATKWINEYYSVPDFKHICKVLEKLERKPHAIHDFLKDCRNRLQNIPQLMDKYKIDQDLRGHVTKKYDDFMKALENQLEKM